MEQQGEGLEVWSDAAGEDADAPAWDEVWQRMQRDGRASTVNHPTPAHADFQIAAPRIGRFSELRLK